METAGGGWVLVGSWSNVDGWNMDNGRVWDWGKTPESSGYNGPAGSWISDADDNNPCSASDQVDCKASAYSRYPGGELLAIEDSQGHVGIRSWVLTGDPRTMQQIFSVHDSPNIAESSELIQTPGAGYDRMALAYEEDSGQLAVNVGIENDGFHLDGWSTSSTSSRQCGSGLGCFVDGGLSYNCAGDVLTNAKGTIEWSQGGSRFEQHTVWLYMR